MNSQRDEFSKDEVVKMAEWLSGISNKVKLSLEGLKSQRIYPVAEGIATRDECESNLLLANRLKSSAIDLAELANASHTLGKELLKRSEGLILIGKGDALIKERGFPKVTEALRSAVIDSDPYLATLRRELSQLNSLLESAEKYSWCLKEDETTWRDLVSAKYRKELI